MLPFSALDFRQRPWVPDSGWPFDAEELRPYEARARSLAGLPDRVDDASEVASAGRPLLPLPREQVRTAVEWFADPVRFSEDLPRRVGRRRDVTVLTHATATAITAEHTSTAVSGVELRTLEGRRISIGARRVVLATGGIENARLLLESCDRHPNGLGNDRDLVGRYYTDHTKLLAADFVPAEPAIFDRMGFYDIHRAGGGILTGKLQLTEDAQRDASLLNAAVRFEARPSAETAAAARALHALLSDVRHLRPRSATFLDPVRHRRGLPSLGRLGIELAARQRRPLPSLTHGWSRLGHPSRHYARFALEIQIEFAPSPDNRITLSDQRNELGQRRPAIHWRWSDLERHTVRETIARLGAAFEDANLGRITFRDEADIEVITPAGDNHPTGTTRMHRDPARGVVDENGRVHGLQNLYIAGSSVFPTSGYANPTLTIVTMAARLGAHLKTTG
jgi:choline dehydrogenase-like flavoprotein